MRHIEIQTAHHVTINYELADAKDRIIAFGIDWLIQIVSLVLLSILVVRIGMNEDLYVYFIVLPFLFFYHLVSEIVMDGQSPGKRLLGLKVVKLSGANPAMNDYLLRWILRPIDNLFSLGTIAALLINSSDKGQRLGDIMANTTVIRMSPTQNIRLNDLMKIRSLETYSPEYQGVTQFAESDMLLFKEVIDRYQKYKNDAHEQALVDVAYFLRDRLGLDKVPVDKELFVRTVIKDYVALTR